MIMEARSFEDHLEIWVLNGRIGFDAHISKRIKKEMRILIPEMDFDQISQLMGWGLSTTLEDEIIVRLKTLIPEMDLGQIKIVMTKKLARKLQNEIIARLKDKNMRGFIFEECVRVYRLAKNNGLGDLKEVIFKTVEG